MFRQLLQNLQSYEKEFENWQPHHFLEAKSETLKQAVERSLQQEPTFDHFLQKGTAADAIALVELLREEVPMMTVATLKGILDALYKHEALQEDISQELVGWYRSQGWKFPPFKFEKLSVDQQLPQKIEDQPAAQADTTNILTLLEDGQSDVRVSATDEESGEGQTAVDGSL